MKRSAVLASATLAVSLPCLAACAPATAPPAVADGSEARRIHPTEADAAFPMPTENWLEEKAEEKQLGRRKKWFEERHKAGPDVDWRARERANGEAQVEKRNRLARSQALTIASPWVERGSENLAGRVHATAPSTDGQWLYLGTSLGGVWKGRPDGSEWTPLGDNLYGGAHWLAVVPGATSGAPDVLLAATDGGIVHVTADEGQTWSVPANIGNEQEVHRALVTSDGSYTVFLVKRRLGQFRLFRSTDRMATFQEVFNFGSFAGDVWAERDGGSDLYLLDNAGVYLSVDLGTSWTLVGAPPAGATRCELSGSEAGAPRLWAVLEIGGVRQVHRSDDAGATWSFVTDISDYWGTINASIVDAGTFAYAGVEVHRTYDAGASFSIVNAWHHYYGDPVHKLHADVPGIDVVPGGPAGETWYVATDGGLFRSQDVLLSVLNLSLSGLRVSQYYSTHTSSANPEHVVAGAQDQGYQRADAPPGASGTQLAFDQLISGDYGHLTSGDGDHDFLYSVYPGFILAQVGENAPNLFQLNFPPGEVSAWMPPVVADPLDPRHFFFCASHLYRYTKNAGNSWTRSLWSTFDFETAGGEYLSGFAFSPVDPQRAYAVTSHGRLYHSVDRGVTWTPSASTGPSGQYFYGTALLASSSDVDTVWVGGSGYSGPAIYQSVDGGVTFQPFETGLPPTLVYCLGEAPDGSGTLFCGTETAAYRRDAGAPSWVDATGADAPITIYWSVEALADENTLRFATYGRGIWDYQLDAQARALVRNGSGVNRVCLSSVTPPELGGTWSVNVQSGGHSGALGSTLFVYDAPAAGPTLGFGEVLVDLSGGARLFVASRPASGGQDTYSFPVPSDPALLGFEAFSQALISGGGLELCNALDVVLGY